ncbi:MerR HTH family regulatory protein [Methylobacterium sp. 174MFSha1.1]|uniref:MerR family transcriptional regulator n=1 Tax=Methylobacterium sp. 174MFSha1.1 TaxID=1502749 RepID=UPI0008E69124|nr:MerR family transcriptional regulator [Methylobacterium sp. 174MFSha1.1]SFU38701.1 MerR HTH family regulatory protein [Methylobacterium sp. 174MFSha1.1]
MPSPSQAAPSYVTIAAAAEQVGEPAHVLRFWQQQFPQIRPLIRAGGRRLYDRATLELLAGIRHLLRDQGRTIAGARQVLDQHGAAHVRALGIAARDQASSPMPPDIVRGELDVTAARAIDSGTSAQLVGEQLVLAGIQMLRDCGAGAGTLEMLALAYEQPKPATSAVR